MRIRKNSRISPPSLPNPSTPSPSSAPPIRETQLQVCQLNQSPWDVMPFPSQSEFFSFSKNYQVHMKDAGNSDSVGEESESADSSIASTKRHLREDEEVEMEEHDRRYKKKGVVMCIRTDGKGWKCKNKATGRNSLCEHHNNLLKSYQHKQSHSSSSKKSLVPKSAAVVARKRKKKSKASSAAAPEEIYYYSGFGPLWGRKRAVGRGPSKDEVGDAVAAVAAAQTSSSAQSSASAQTSSASEHREGSYARDDDDDDGVEKGNVVETIVHYDEDDDDDDDDDYDYGNGGKKRTRRPIKERSLNSLF